MREEETCSFSAPKYDEDHLQSDTREDAAPNGVIFHLKEATENGRKKTKRKKKKKASGFKAQAEQRFETVVEQLKSRDADGLWVSLGSCDLHDSSMATLTEALASNTTVTSLDLSHNSITSVGAKALFGALGAGAASDLIELDMRGNPFSSEDHKSLAHLWSVRKQLTVLVGALKSSEPAVSVSPFALRANSIADEEEEEAEKDSSNGNGYNSPLIMQFFQMGNDDETKPNGGAVEPEVPEEDAEVVAERLWGQVEQELQQDADTNYALSDALREICTAVQLEMASCQLPMLDSTCADDLKPHTTHAFRRLHLLPAVLDQVPPPVFWPTSNGIPQAAIGSHRLAVAEMGALLVGAGAVVLDEAVASTGITPRLVHLCFAHPANNALHAVTLKLLRAALSSKISDLWRPLLETEMSAAGASDSRAEPASALPPLQRQLAAVGIAVADMPQGRRPPLSGFVVAVAALLQAHSRDGLASGILQERLEGDEEWREFTEDGGALQRLLQEQEGGDLGGPRPRAQPLLDGPAGYGDGCEEADGLRNGSYMFNCRELMGMLRHMPQLSATPRG